MRYQRFANDYKSERDNVQHCIFKHEIRFNIRMNMLTTSTSHAATFVFVRGTIIVNITEVQFLVALSF